MEEDTFDKFKNKAKDVAEKVTDSAKDVTEKVTDTDTYLGEKEGNGNNNEGYATEGKHESKEPMDPEKVGEHEPTAVKRDKKQGSSGDPV
jgi:hypothetical protein